MNTVKDVGFCEFCSKVKINKTYYVYRLGFITNLGEFNVGILNISNELGNFLMARGSHLSATQVILLRPDITLEFLRNKYNSEEEQIQKYYLFEAEICHNCYQEYIKEVPER